METIDIYKHQDFEDTGSNAVDVNVLVKKLRNRLTQRSDKNFKDELKDLLKIIKGTLKPKKYAIIGNGISIGPQDYRKELLRNISLVNNVVDKYLDGRISQCYIMLDDWWNGKGKAIGVRSMPFNIFRPGDRDKYFRMRIKDDSEFTTKDMFHVPFEKRGKVGNERYSVSGFPCLYIGSSFYVCWEEMGRPDLKDIVASSLRCTYDDVRLLDLRLTQVIKDNIQLENFLVLLPVIVACSVMVRKSDKDSKFKAEYILPQLILHSIIQTTGNNYRYDGIIYTTTKSDLFFDDLSLMENVVIPVKKSGNEGHCSTLLQWFKITPPVYLEREMMKNPTDFTLSYTEMTEYDASIFGMAEEVIEKKKYQRVEVSSKK